MHACRLPTVTLAAAAALQDFLIIIIIIIKLPNQAIASTPSLRLLLLLLFKISCHVHCAVTSVEICANCFLTRWAVSTKCQPAYLCA
jgi:hypothetical protein